MTDPDDTTSTRPISVAELLAKNGTIGAPPAGGRRRRRRGNSDAVTVAELTGEIPIVNTGSMPVFREPVAEPEPEPVAEPEAVAEPDVEAEPVEAEAELEPVVEPEPAEPEELGSEADLEPEPVEAE